MPYYRFKDWIAPNDEKRIRRPFQEQITRFVEFNKDEDFTRITGYQDILQAYSFTSFIEDFFRLTIVGSEFGYFLSQGFAIDVSLSIEEYQEILDSRTARRFIIPILIYYQENVHIHTDGSKTYILHDLCRRFNDDYLSICDIFDQVLKQTKKFVWNSKQDLLLTFDDNGLSPCQYLHPNINLKYRRMVTPKWSPTTHRYLPKTTIHTVETLFLLNSIDTNIWNIIPLELMFEIISLAVDLDETDGK